MRVHSKGSTGIEDDLTPQLKHRRVRIPLLTGLLLSSCVIFLQVGFTYYLSFQVLALVLLLIIVVKNRPSVVNLSPILLFVAVFAVFLSATAIDVPLAVSQNSRNIFVTCVGVIGYAIMIIGAPNIAFRSPEKILHFFRFVSSATLIAIVGVLVVSELAIIPFLTRETLVLMNVALIDNWATTEVLASSFHYLERTGLEPDINLFYGEHSFLSVVILTCIASKVISESQLRAIELRMYEEAPHVRQGELFPFVANNSKGILIGLALASMLYIKSFSSFFYVPVICVSLFLSDKRRRFHCKLTPKRLLVALLVVIVLGVVVWKSFDYYAHRLTSVSDSQSFQQRFSSVFDFGVQEYIFGITNATNVPEVGFHNGFLYIIGISGFGGVCFIGFLFCRVYRLARPIGLSLLAVMCIFGIVSQNGGIFSPSKVVLVSLVSIPLSCLNRSRLAKHMTVENDQSPTDLQLSTAF